MKRSHLFRLILSVAILAAAFATVSPGFTADNHAKVRVWVEFVPGQKGSLENTLHAAGAELHYTFENLNALVVTLPENALAGIQRNPNVVSIEEDARRELFGQEVPYGIDLVQARQVWDANKDGTLDDGAPTGAGSLVCIIDSGLFTGHEDFEGVNVVGGYPTGWNTDKCGHGTHVAGTIAAAMNTTGVVGVTPGKASLYIVKVFGDSCGWTYSSSLVDAANRCAAQGAKIINMSLGGPTKNAIEERGFKNLYSQGILSIAAAGNDGTTAINYPGGYASVMSVAAVDKNMVVADFSQKNTSVEIAAPGVGVMSTVSYLAVANVTVNGVVTPGIHVEFAKYGSASGSLVDGGLCTSAGAWTGKVVLCQRGTISFFDKVKNVQAGGGVAALIYNNEVGDLHATLGEGNTSTIPALGLTTASGEALMGKLGQTATVNDTITYSVSGYEAWDGTSMATPHVAGVAALVWSSNSALTNVQVRDALVKTAKDLGAVGKDNSYGYGLVQAFAAWQYLGGGGGGGGTTPLAVSVVTDKTSYKFNQLVTITTEVKDNMGSPVSGASVALTLKTGGGKTYTGSAVTDAAGRALFTYTPKNADGAGTYTASVTASMSGFASSTSSVTFTVTK